MGWNIGLVAGQTMMHAHMHVIARKDNMPDAGSGIRAFIKQARKGM